MSADSHLSRRPRLARALRLAAFVSVLPTARILGAEAIPAESPATLTVPPVNPGSVPRAPEGLLTPAPEAAPPVFSPQELAAAPISEKPVYLTSMYFNVTGPDAASAGTVMRMTQRLQTLLSRYFPWPGQNVLPVQIQLTPADSAEFSGPFAIRSGREGFRLLFIRWGPDTSFSDVALALASVGLEYVVVAQNGPEAGARIPAWLKLAFGRMLESQIKPALAGTLAAQAREKPALSLRQIMDAPWPDDAARPAIALDSFWLAQFLADNAGSTENSRTLFPALAAGGNPVPALQQFFPGEFSNPKTLELWWQVAYRSVVDSREPPVETFAQSRATLAEFETVTVQRRGEPRRVPLNEAWPEHAQPETRAALQRLLIVASQRQPFVNPVYNNAFKTLRQVQLALLGGDEAVLRKYWDAYQADLAQSRAIEATVVEAMR